jgi:hypothetical protein
MHSSVSSLRFSERQGDRLSILALSPYIKNKYGP